MRLHEIMNSEVVRIDAGESASDAWALMQRRRIRHLVVTEHAQLAGVLSERDLGGRNGESVRMGRSVRDLMTRDIVTAAPDMTLRQAANLMRGRLVGSLPVLDDARVVGIVTATDVLDQLGRGSTRPDARAERQNLRFPATKLKETGRAGARARPRARARTARGRARKPDSEERTPFAGAIARPDKRAAGRTGARQIPANIRVAGVTIDDDSRDYIRRKLGMKLGKFADSIERVTVRLQDVNGPRGGVDKLCRAKVVLSGLPSVLFEAQDASLNAAIDETLSGVERTVRKHVRRRRTKPLRPRTLGPASLQ